ncbi:pilus assembly protein N-terminal domain-containing protein [Shewanella frigidimarina]|uniref:pilus assembly protein N-terminal domain-containing protein n=1 Tax=Shewanella frigidimarina TaxID=56812 RepID=UPI003D7BB96B
MKQSLCVTSICMLLVSMSVFAGTKGLDFIETADGRQSSMIREMVQWTHSRLVFKKSISRVAIGQDAIMQVEVLDKNEVLALAKKVGRTSLIVWYTDDTSETFLFSVTEDLSVLRQALSDIHPKIRLTLAPDRAALVLRGRVPTVKYKLAAETAARHYLDAGKNRISDNNSLVMKSPTDFLADLSPNIRLPSQQLRQSNRGKVGHAAIINLIQVDVLPMNMIEKVKKAIVQLGGESVTVSRIQKGDMPDDQADTLLLGGQVETQVDLVRVLNLASRLFTGDRINAITGKIEAGSNDITVIANESGGLISSSQQVSSNSSSNRGGNAKSSSNNVKSNIARAKLLSMANGRLLSTIEVRDLPQVRVAIQMYEVNRRSLTQWRPDFSLITQGYNKTDGNFGLDGATNQALGSGKVENALQVLGGALVNNFQVGGSEIAFDLLFSLLEKDGISRTLSRPTLTVLAGEKAVFRAGGEVPVPTSFSPNGISSANGGNSQGVFSGTEFKSFGIQLEVRAMVDENDLITLDLSPSISTPDTLLTQQISSSTGSSLTTSAFNVRNLTTSTRLRDGQPLIIGGLVSRDISDSRDFVPGINDVPLLGKLTESSSGADTARELIIIVTPTLVREPRHDVALWQFQTSAEMLQSMQFPLADSSL